MKTSRSSVNVFFGVTYIRKKVKKLVFNRFEDDVSRPYLRLNRNLRFPEKVIVKVRRTVNGEEVRIVYEPESNNPLITAEGLIK